LEKADILISGCIVLPMKNRSFIKNGAIAVKDRKIVFVGKSSSVAGMVAGLKIDAKGKVALPGLINCHTHVPMTLFRGVAEDQPLNDWLKKIIWPLEAKLSSEDIYLGSVLGCLEMIRSGTTCLSDTYFHEDMVAKAVKASGLRGVLAEGIIEGGNKAFAERMLKRSVGFAKSFHGYADGRVDVMLGPHAAYSCSPELLTKVAEEASRLGVGVHLHVAESRAMFDELEKKYGCGEVEFLDKLGVLKGNVVAAHCIDLTNKDRRILAERDVSVVYCPVANMKLGLGAAHVKDLLDLGVRVGLGTDGPASNNSLDMFETMKFGALLQKAVYRDPTVLSAYRTLEMATIDGARVLGLGEQVGSLEVGKKADVILVDLSKPHLKPLHDVYANLVYSARGSDVDTVIVNGKILMQNQQVKTLDEQMVMEKAEQAAFKLTSQ
jgi:5-methylthioadenosine/S-adenosylhomocysteine deaminase